MTSSDAPARYAVFGNPIAHSKSPEIHQAFARQTQQNIEYSKKLVEPEAFSSVTDAFFAEGGMGLNITVPFKQEAFNYAKVLTPRARAAGAVNTLAKQEDGTIIGDNTDGVGLVSDMLHRLQWTLKDKTVLIIGAGGAVRGVLLPLLHTEPASLTIVNRTSAKAKALAEHFVDYGEITACDFNSLQGSSFDIVINGTSASLSGELPPIPISTFTPETCVYDMVYDIGLTPFLQFAKDQGVTATHLADGFGMLVGQAAESFYLWRGVKPDIAPIIEQLKK
ncbi:Shikimate dehydrogenase (NADP(+)) [Thalassocella blandensis]|nr:Shikimate dehydrogenase (NADP(+)) [Thalassocella blandensis]